MKVLGKKTTTSHWTILQAGEIPTSTKLTISALDVGDTIGASTFAFDWKAVVTGSGASSPTPTSGQVTFTFSLGRMFLAAFTGPASNPAECTFNLEITATGETYDAAAPDVCSGGTAGYVYLTLAMALYPGESVVASYSGGAGWAPSTSGSVDPSTVYYGNPSSA